MIQRPPISTPTHTLFPYPSLFLSGRDRRRLRRLCYFFVVAREGVRSVLQGRQRPELGKAQRVRSRAVNRARGRQRPRRRDRAPRPDTSRTNRAHVLAGQSPRRRPAHGVREEDRKRVVQGKRLSDRLEQGGGRVSIKKKTET